LTYSNKIERFNQLRDEYISFHYTNYKYIINNKTLILTYIYNLKNSDTHKSDSFTHSIEIPLLDENIVVQEFETAIFHIGLVECINYWKIAAPKKLIIECGNINDEQKIWFKKLFFRGLSEYLFVNQIIIDEKDLFEFVIESDKEHKLITSETQDRCMIPIGGGKDSLVTYEILKQAFEDNYIFSINPIKASQAILEENQNNAITLKRKLDLEKILDYNAKKYLNGHIPFSSIVGFISILLGLIYKSKYIALSNEASANEGNIEFNNIEVNHQYSKSLEFENDFRWYIENYVTKNVKYFSFLRPLDEITIGKLFAYNHKYFDIFLSCNVGSKKNEWCSQCPKCLFTYLMLCNYIDDEDMVKIFGKNLLESRILENEFINLTQSDKVKPLECVGTYDEVNYAVSLKIDSYKKANKSLPYLLSIYQQEKKVYDFVIDFEHNNNLEDKFKKILKEYVAKVN